MALSLSFLGGFQAVADGAPVRLPTRKAEALLAHLACRPGAALSREWLATQLWPRSAEAQSRASLRQTLAAIRKALTETDAGSIEATGDAVFLKAANLFVDVPRFETASSSESPSAWAEGASLYRGDFLSGFSVPEEPFEEWVRGERGRLRRAAVDLSDRLIDHYLSIGEIDKGVNIAEDLLRLDRTHEPAYRALMRLHAAAGARADALKAFERCRTVLADDLGIEPSEETRALKQEVVRDSEAAKPVGVEPPVVAVLPLANLTGDSANDTLALGIAEDILMNLSRFRPLQVISRASSFSCAGRGLSAVDIGRELGAHYLLEGSMRRMGYNLRFAMRFESASGRQLWAETFDANFGNIANIHDEIAAKVAAALMLHIDDERLSDAKQQTTSDLAAYDCWVRGWDRLFDGTVESDLSARQFFRKAIDIDPNWARPYAGMSLSHFNEWSCQAWDKWEENEREAFRYASEAVRLDPSDHIGQCILGRIVLIRRRFDEAEMHLERALELNPNDPFCLTAVSWAFAHTGQPERAIELGLKALRLNPVHGAWAMVGLAMAQFLVGNRADALKIAEMAPDSHVDTRAFLASGYALTGDMDKAEAHLAQFYKNFREKITFGREPEPLEPYRWILRVHPYRRQEDIDVLTEGLGRAGLPTG